MEAVNRVGRRDTLGSARLVQDGLLEPAAAS